MLRKIWNVLKRTIHGENAENERIKMYEESNILVEEGACITDDCTIGAYSYIGSNTEIRHTSIGRYVSIGSNCNIAPGEHRTNLVSTSYRIYKNRIGDIYYDGDNGKRKGGVVIGNDVWIGCHVVARRGIKIGNGAIVGANSFVDKDVPDFAIVAGSPAKIIRYRFNDAIIHEIEQSSWWDYELDEARDIIDCLEKKMEISLFKDE